MIRRCSLICGFFLIILWVNGCATSGGAAGAVHLSWQPTAEARAGAFGEVPVTVVLDEIRDDELGKILLTALHERGLTVQKWIGGPLKYPVVKCRQQQQVNGTSLDVTLTVVVYDRQGHSVARAEGTCTDCRDTDQFVPGVRQLATELARLR